MDRLRWIVVAIIVGALAGGVFGRMRSTHSDLAESHFEIRAPSDSDGLHVAGVFVEPLRNMTGYEISWPRCSRPFAVLPFSSLAVAPSEYHYRDPGEYIVSYAYNDGIYPEGGIRMRLRLLHMRNRIQSMFLGTDAGSFAYYLKIWAPPDCAGVSAEEAARLQHSLIAKVQPKSASAP